MDVFPGGLARARELLTRYWGYPSFRVPQLRVLGPLLTGRSVLSVLPTGAGKSLCYQVPALMANGHILMLSRFFPFVLSLSKHSAIHQSASKP